VGIIAQLKAVFPTVPEKFLVKGPSPKTSFRRTHYTSLVEFRRVGYSHTMTATRADACDFLDPYMLLCIVYDVISQQYVLLCVPVHRPLPSHYRVYRHYVIDVRTPFLSPD